MIRIVGYSYVHTICRIIEGRVMSKKKGVLIYHINIYVYIHIQIFMYLICFMQQYNF